MHPQSYFAVALASLVWACMMVGQLFEGPNHMEMRKTWSNPIVPETEGRHIEPIFWLFLDRVTFYRIASGKFSGTMVGTSTTSLCILYVISAVLTTIHRKLIYSHGTNGRAECLVTSVVDPVQAYLVATNTPTNQWYWKLPLAVWALNDLPGAIAPCSPHRLFFKRDSIVW